jgi:hypothetical protein
MTAQAPALEIDDHELEQLEIDLREAPARVQLGTKSRLKKGAEIVDHEMVKDARGHRFLPRFPRNISHELIDRYTAEIGFNRSKGLQGSLVWIILDGSINNLPVWDKYAALRRSTPAVLELFGSMAEDSVLGTREA